MILSFTILMEINVTWLDCRPCRHTSRSWWGSAGSGWWSRAPRWSLGGWPSPRGRSSPRPSRPCSSSRCCTLSPDSNIKQLPSPLWHYLRSTLVICHEQRGHGQHNLWKSQKHRESIFTVTNITPQITPANQISTQDKSSHSKAGAVWWWYLSPA